MKLTRLDLDYTARTATLHASIYIGDVNAATQDQRDETRDATIILEGLQFCVIERPDPRDDYAKPVDS